MLRTTTVQEVLVQTLVRSWVVDGRDTTEDLMTPQSRAKQAPVEKYFYKDTRAIDNKHAATEQQRFSPHSDLIHYKD